MFSILVFANGDVPGLGFGILAMISAASFVVPDDLFCVISVILLSYKSVLYHFWDYV
jgi:hypothetical protein